MYQRLSTNLKRGSVARQIGFVVFFIFSTMIAFNTYIVWQQSKAAMHEQVTKQVIQINESFFDSLNTLMLIGSMDQRETLREKLLQDPNILDIRVLRGDSVNTQYGEGLASEAPRNKIEQLALQGTKSIDVREKSGVRVLTVALPYRATAATRGVNCLKCHDVPSGTVNGAIRIDYSLQQVDQAIHDTLWDNIIINVFIMLFGVLSLTIYMHRNLTRGISEADKFAESITRQNFDVDIPTVRKDNIGRLMYSLIRMRDSLIRQFDDAKKAHEDERLEMDAKITQQEKETNLVIAFESGIVNVVHNMNQATADAANSAALLSGISAGINQNSSAAESGTKEVLEKVADTTSSTHEISQAFREITQRGQEAINISERAMHDASATSQRMETLQSASDDIGSVIATITEIAEKTNLLALNASIEAARAGDVGRGFAVVANEVKSLATQTTQATEVISTQIQEVQTECLSAISSIEGISQIIMRMNEHTHDVAKIMDQYTGTLDTLEMNADTANQGMQSVRNTIKDVSQSAEKSDVASNEVTQHCTHLKAIALEQEQLVNQFLSMLQSIRSSNDPDKTQDDDDDLF